MDPEIQEIRATVEENNKILHKLLMHNRWSTVTSIIKWVIVIGAAFGIYYYLQPIMDQLIKTYQSISSFTGGVFGL